MASFSRPRLPRTRGLRTPLEALLEMTETLYDVNLEVDDGNDVGVYFDGTSYTLYPAAYIQDRHVIPRHLEAKGGHHDSERNHVVTPDTGRAPSWERISNFETLRSAWRSYDACLSLMYETAKE
jgi:hypothetical protein